MSLVVATNASVPSNFMSARRRKVTGRTIVYGALLAFLLFYLLPLVVMLLTSFKTMDDIRTGTLLSMPKEFTIEPWLVAWSSACVGVECIGIKGFYWNTIVMAVPASTTTQALPICS